MFFLVLLSFFGQMTIHVIIIEEKVMWCASPALKAMEGKLWKA